MTETQTSIENSVEGPKLRAEVHISKSEYHKLLSMGRTREEIAQGLPPQNATDYVYEQISKSLPENELRVAFLLAKRERSKQGQGNVDYNKVKTRDAKKYAFRGIKRKSDGSATEEHREATLEAADRNIHTIGLDASHKTVPSAKHLLPGRIWDIYTFPTEEEMRRHEIDVTKILVYVNRPFVLPSEAGQNTTILTDVSKKNVNDRQREITIQKAKRNKYPTLRDNYIGQIEVHFDDTEPTQTDSVKSEVQSQNSSHKPSIFQRLLSRK